MKTTETTRVFSNDGQDAFCITQDHLEGIKATDKEMSLVSGGGMETYFKLYDDDDVLYYSGYFNDDLIDDEFDILDWAMNDSGCTRMDVRNRLNGKMETL